MLYDINDYIVSMREFHKQSMFLDFDQYDRLVLKPTNTIIIRCGTLVMCSTLHYHSHLENQSVKIEIKCEDNEQLNKIKTHLTHINNSTFTYFEKISEIINCLRQERIVSNIDIANIEVKPNDKYKIDRNEINIKYNDNFIIIECEYNFYVYIKLFQGSYSNNKEKMMNCCLIFFENNNYNSILDFEVVISPILNSNIYNIFDNIYYYPISNDKIQFLLKSDIYGNNPLQISRAFKKMMQDTYFHNLF